MQDNSTYQVGDYIKCIDIDDGITLNKVYTITAVRKGMLEIENDDGVKLYYSQFCFIKTDEVPVINMFKIDKIGKYKTRRGLVFKVVYIYENKIAFSVTEYENPMNYSVEGKSLVGGYSEYDLVEYIGE